MRWRGTLRGGSPTPFLGRQDLAAGVIRCVGDPTQRLREDALRIFRALRFASVLGFAIAPETDRALRKERSGLARIAPERIREELVRLLCGKSAEQILDRYAEIFFEVLEPLRPMWGFDQCNPHHDRDVWHHTLAAVTAAPADPLLRLAALLHDAGKPRPFRGTARGLGTFTAMRSAALRLPIRCCVGCTATGRPSAAWWSWCGCTICRSLPSRGCCAAGWPALGRSSCCG